MAGSALEACRTTTRTDQRTEQRTRQFAPRKTFFSSSTCSFRNHLPFVPLPLPTNLSLPGGTHHPMWFVPTFHETFACFFSVAASLLRCSCFDVSEVARISREGSVVFLRGPFPVFFFFLTGKLLFRPFSFAFPLPRSLFAPRTDPVAEALLRSSRKKPIVTVSTLGFPFTRVLGRACFRAGVAASHAAQVRCDGSVAFYASRGLLSAAETRRVATVCSFARFGAPPSHV